MVNSKCISIVFIDVLSQTFNWAITHSFPFYYSDLFTAATRFSLVFWVSHSLDVDIAILVIDINCLHRRNIFRIHHHREITSSWRFAISWSWSSIVQFLLRIWKQLGGSIRNRIKTILLLWIPFNCFQHFHWIINVFKFFGSILVSLDAFFLFWPISVILDCSHFVIMPYRWTFFLAHLLL